MVSALWSRHVRCVLSCESTAAVMTDEGPCFRPGTYKTPETLVLPVAVGVVMRSHRGRRGPAPAPCGCAVLTDEGRYTVYTLSGQRSGTLVLVLEFECTLKRSIRFGGRSVVRRDARHALSGAALGSLGLPARCRNPPSLPNFTWAVGGSADTAGMPLECTDFWIAPRWECHRLVPPAESACRSLLKTGGR